MTKKCASRGFTLIELIVVMVLIGIVSAYVAAKLDIKGIAGRDFYDRATGAIRYAQKLAIAQHRSVYVCLDSRVAVGFDSACTSLANDPGGGSLNFSSSDVTVSGASFNFDYEGRPSAGATISFTAGSATYSLTVESETGYVHS